MTEMLKGPRYEIGIDDDLYPRAFFNLKDPPSRLYLIGAPDALQEGLAIVGARKATPYGRSCARHFAGIAASRGIAVISGGARGCDAESHRAALDAGGVTVAFLGGGCDRVYPPENLGLFQRIVDYGGAVVSENAWDTHPVGYMHRLRNRLIAGLAKATLIVEAGLPSGTFTTADAALEANREVLVIPGAITSRHSRGANQLIYQGATPIVGDDSFADQLFSIFGALRQQSACAEGQQPMELAEGEEALLDALQAQHLSLDEMLGVAAASGVADGSLKWLMEWLARMQKAGLVAKYPSGRYGPVARPT